MSSKKHTRNKLAELSRDSFYAFLRSSPTAEGKKFKHTKFHEYLAYTLQGVAHDTLINNKSRWVLLSVPPRHGKTYTTCQSFPAWCFGAYQEQSPKFIVTSYSPTMTAESGGNARMIINSPFYRSVFPEVQLRTDKKSKLNFGIEGGGSFFGTGVGSPVTGFGANCFTADTKIMTERGLVKIKDLAHLQDKPKVLSYNHEKEITEYKSIEAAREIIQTKKRVLRIKTKQGRVIEATEDHRFFDGERYKELRLFKPGENLWVSRLQKNKDRGNRSNMCNVFKNILAEAGCTSKVFKKRNGRFLLFSGMFEKSSRNKKSQRLHTVWGNDAKRKNWKVLLKKMQTFIGALTKKDLSTLRIQFPAQSSQSKILFKKMCGYKPLRKNDGEKQPKLSTWKWTRRISERISLDKKIYNQEGQQYLCCVPQEAESLCSPHRRKCSKQSSHKPCDTVQFLSSETSLLTPDTISLVEELCGEQDVYDIQVADNHNFFAEGILVHNCLLIDDPYKGRREAESKTIQRDVQEYFESTLLSRIEANGSLVVIMQRWNQNDLVQFIIDNHPKWKKKNPSIPELEIISFPAIAEEDEYYPSGKLFRSEGESLAPEVGYTVNEMLGKKATMDPYYWFSQYQQNPIDKSAATFKKEMFRHYTPADIKDKFLVYYTFIDPAISKKEGADELVILTLGYDVENDYIYRIHETAGHYEPEEFYKVLYDEHLSRFKIKELVIEAESFQQVYRFGIEKLRDRIRGGFSIKEFRGKRLRGGNNKELRIEGLLGFYQRGVILHRDFGDEKYEEQLLTFPNGRHDDRIDCMSFFPDFMIPKYSRDVEIDQLPIDAFDFSFTPR